MRGWMRFVLGLAALAGSGVAQAQAPIEGLYVVERMETASMLELMPEGRFRWFFSYGALDMSAEGRWRWEGDAVLLDTEPPVAPPRIQYVGTGSEAGEGLLVQVKDAQGNTPEYLDVEAQYESGEPDRATLDEDGYRFPPSDRRITSVRVGSRIFQFWADPVAVPAGARQLRFRFEPGDLGRADFRGARAALAGETLTLAVMGEPLEYRRMSVEEQAALDAATRQAEADIEAAADAAAGAMDAAARAGSPEDWGRCFDETGSVEAADGIAACTALLDSGQLVEQDRAAVLYGRGSFRNESGNYDAAIADFDEAIRLSPEFGLAYGGRADAYEYRGDFRRAAADARIAVQLEPDNADLLNGLCWQLGLANEELDRAREACDAALRLQPDDPPTLDSRGLIGLRQQRYGSAWNDYDAAIRLGPEDPDLAHFHYGRGIAALRLGRAAEGQADIARARQLNDLIADVYARFGITP